MMIQSDLHGDMKKPAEMTGSAKASNKSVAVTFSYSVERYNVWRLRSVMTVEKPCYMLEHLRIPQYRSVKICGCRQSAGKS